MRPPARRLRRLALLSDCRCGCCWQCQVWERTIAAIRSEWLQERQASAASPPGFFVLYLDHWLNRGRQRRGRLHPS